MRLFLISLLLVPMFAMADITRNCESSVSIFVNDNKPNAYATLGEVLGKGSCDGVVKANTCRERARKAIDLCLASLWKNRHVNEIPDACDNYYEGSSHAGAKLTYSGIIPIEQDLRLLSRGQFVACCNLRPNAQKVKVEFGGVISGDKKCGATKIGKDLYQSEFAFNDVTFDCQDYRDRGFCN